MSGKRTFRHVDDVQFTSQRQQGAKRIFHERSNRADGSNNQLLSLPKTNPDYARCRSHLGSTKADRDNKFCFRFDQSTGDYLTPKPPKGLKPQLKEAAEPKKKQAAQPAAKKEKPAEEAAAPKKDINPLDALPPSPWNFFDFKTLYVNHPDKAGGGIEELKKQYDPEGYTFWYTKYDKFGTEGQVMYKFENLMKGFLQRFDHFRKHAFGKLNMIGEEPNLDICGVWCFRGKELPQECHDHPQWEYMNTRKMDINNADDIKLIAQHWSATVGSEIEGVKC